MNCSVIPACVAAATLSTLLSWAPPARAHEADAPHRHTPKPQDPNFDPDRYRSKRYGAFEFRVGPYLPNVDSEFEGVSPLQDSFGTKQRWILGFEADWQAFRIPNFGSIGPGFAWHWAQLRGVAEFTGDNEKSSAHPHKLWLMPMYVVGVLRVDVLAKRFEIPLVPYVKGGFATTIWESRDAGNVSEADGVVGRGIETGLQFQLGAMVHLNPLAPQSAVDLDNASGVNNSYLFIEWWKSSVDSFGNGMQVGDSTFVGGLALEF